jgi:hypothetical protein
MPQRNLPPLQGVTTGLTVHVKGTVVQRTNDLGHAVSTALQGMNESTNANFARAASA